MTLLVLEQAGLLLNGSNVLPANGSGTAVNNDRDLGSSSYRWRDIYTNGAVNTSDQNEKQQIAALTTAEIAAAKAFQLYLRHLSGTMQ